MGISKKFLNQLSECIQKGFLDVNKEKEKLKKPLLEINKKQQLKELDEDFTYKGLYKFLIENPYNKIDDFILEFKNQKKFEPQESIFRLFAMLKLFDIKIDGKTLSIDYDVSNSNFSLGKLDPIDNYDKYKKSIKNNLKDKGDISDLTFISKDNKEIIVCSSKNFNKAHTKFDIDEIYEVYNNRFKDNNYKISVILVVPNKEDVNKAVDRMLDSSSSIRKLLKKTIKIDWNDLNEAYIEFKRKFTTKKSYKIFPKMEKGELKLYLNQRYSVNKAIKLINEGNGEPILLGQKPRSGKTYIMAGIIAEDVKRKVEGKKNFYVIITPVPSETKQQYIDALNYRDFENCQILDLTKDTLKQKIKKDDLIIIVSKQFLGIRVKEDDEEPSEDSEDKSFIQKKKFFKKLIKEGYNHRVIFFDEVHYGGTTKESKNILDEYKLNEASKIFVTATYDKPINSYGIKQSNFILWDLDDENMCKAINFDRETKRQRLIEKHGETFEKILNEYTDEQIVKRYEGAPHLKLFLMRKVDDTNDFIKSNNDEIGDMSFPPGFSTTALFTVINKECKDERCEFLYKNSVVKFLEMLFGSSKQSYYNQIDEYCRVNDSRRYTLENPGTIMMFLPESNVNSHSYALKKLINQVNSDIEVLILNNKNDAKNKEKYGTTNVKEIIEKAVQENKNKKKIILALLGKQASIGVTVKSCDIVILADGGITNIDMTWQRLFRCGSDGEGKKFCFVIDTNYHRMFELIGNLANNIRTKESTVSAIKYVLSTNLIEFCNDDWNETVFKKKEVTDEELVDMIYGKYLERNDIKNIMEQINVDKDKLRDTLKGLNMRKGQGTTLNTTGDKGMKREKDEEIDNLAERLAKQKIKEDNEDDSKEDTEEEESIEDKIKKFQEIIEYILPLVILFSKRKDYVMDINILSRFKSLEPELYEKLMTEVNKAWFKDTDNNNIENIVYTYIKNIEDQDNINVINDLSKLFDNKDKLKLYEIIEKNIKKTIVNIEQEADISTPKALVDEMLDKLPKEVWGNEYLTWFEPAAGRGAFIVEIYNRLMQSLKYKIKDQETRSSYILSHMLYMSEINSVNVEILKSIFYTKNTPFEIRETSNIKKGHLQIYFNNNKVYSLSVMEELKKIENKNINNRLSLEQINIDEKELVEKFIDLNLKPKTKEKKEFGEVFTPRQLINEMLDKLPKEVWSNKELKWFDPAVGIGNFMIEIYWRLMDGLKDEMPNFNERKSHIINKMLYMSELNENNIKECKKIFNEEINIYEGDTLKMPNKYFTIDKFDIIVGNPPYQGTHNNRGRLNLWSQFVGMSLESLKADGYLVFVHPSGWRQVNGTASNILKKYDMIYLSIHNEKDGIKNFHSNTRYDWYILKNKKTEEFITEIFNEKGKLEYIDIKHLAFIPNFNIEKIKKLIQNEENDFILNNSSYHTVNKNKNLLKDEKNEEYNIKIVNSVNIKNIPKLLYANKIKDSKHFHPKVIFGSGATGFFTDYKGEYGMTQWSTGIIVDENEIDELMIYLKSSKFKELRDALSITLREINSKALKYFKKDFWK